MLLTFAFIFIPIYNDSIFWSLAFYFRSEKNILSRLVHAYETIEWKNFFQQIFGNFCNYPNNSIGNI